MKDEEFFPVGIWYNGSLSRPPMMPRKSEDAERIKKDLENLKNLGFNTLKYWVDWATCNPEEEEFDFVQVEKFLSTADEYKFKVIIQIYLDSAPNWIARNYPDSLFTAQSGHMVESQASPGYSLDHPNVRERAGRFLEELAKISIKHESLWAWDVWSEPHIVNWSWFDYMGPEPWFDYNEHSRKRFIEWLKQKYKSIQKLNETWYRTYSGWDEVRIPKYVTLSTFQDIMDWQMFTVNKMKEDLAFRVKHIRNIDTKNIISSHSAITSTMTSIMDWGANGDDWEMAKEVDSWGTSFYPAHIGSENPYDPSVMGLFLDASRSSCEFLEKPFWIGELQCGQAVEGLKFGIQVGAREVSKWAWTCISYGAKGLFFYAFYPMSCGEEISGFGLVDSSGNNNERSLSAGKVAKYISNNYELFLNSKPEEAKVAILYSVDVGGMIWALRANHGEFTQSLKGIYRILFEENLPVDFINSNNLDVERLKKYEMIFAPMLFVVDDSLVNLLKEYVKGGGVLVSEFRPGWSNKEGVFSGTIPGYHMDELFGSVEHSVITSKEMDIKLERNGNEFLLRDSIVEVLKTKTSEPILSMPTGEVIATSNAYGKGKAVFIGANLSRYYEKYKENIIGDFMKELIPTEIKRSSEFLVNKKEVHIKVRHTANETLLFVLNTKNHSLSDVRITYDKSKCNSFMVDSISDESTLLIEKNDKQISVLMGLLPSELKVLRFHEA